MRKTQYAFDNFRQIFDRHFRSLSEAHLVEDRALAGDDRSQVLLWRLYRDGYFTEHTAKKAEGSYGLRDSTYQRPHVVCPEAAAYFHGLARQAHHPEAATFSEATQLGCRICMSPYAVYRDGVDDFYEFYLHRPEILAKPHLKYKEDVWWDLVQKNKTETGFVFFADWEHYSSMENGSILTKRGVSLDECAAFLRQTIGNALPSLAICAKAGDVDAASELFRLHNLRTWNVQHGFFDTWKEIPNSFFDQSDARRWKDAHEALAGKGNAALLDSLIFGQQNTASGIYNVGIALLQNQFIREVYNKRSGKPENDLDTARSLIKKAAWAGSAEAAWFCGDTLQSEGEDKSDPECFHDAILFYEQAAVLGHPNAKHRLEYGSIKNSLAGAAKPFPTHETQVEAKMPFPKIFISYAHEDLAQAHQLYDRLKGKGFRPWFDKKSLLPGQTWKREIKDVITKADFVIVCLSRVAVEKRGFFQSEVKWIMEAAANVPFGHIYLIPVRLDDCSVPVELAEQQYVDLFTPDGFQQICEVLVSKGHKASGSSGG